MANEISLTASLTGFKASVMAEAVARSVVGFVANMGGTVYVQNVLLVGTSATLIPLASVTSPHWAFFQNHDATNFLTIRNGSAGADVIKLLAGEPAFVPLLDTGTFYAVANGAACLLEYLIFSL